MTSKPMQIIVSQYQMRNSEGKGLGRRYWIKCSEVSEEELEKGLTRLTSFAFGYNDFPEKSVDVGQVYFTDMPGGGGVVISSGLYIKPEFRGSCYSKMFQELRAKLAWRFGYTKMIATINMSNIPQVVSAAKNGWTFVNTYTDRRSGNLLALIEKGIPDRADWNQYIND